MAPRRALRTWSAARPVARARPPAVLMRHESPTCQQHESQRPTAPALSQTLSSSLKPAVLRHSVCWLPLRWCQHHQQRRQRVHACRPRHACACASQTRTVARPCLSIRMSQPLRHSFANVALRAPQSLRVENAEFRLVAAVALPSRCNVTHRAHAEPLLPTNSGARSAVRAQCIAQRLLRGGIAFGCASAALHSVPCPTCIARPVRCGSPSAAALAPA
jgi:hypothetical protein